MANLRIGIIGCGGIANGKHFPGMAQQEGVDMCAFCDLILERAEKAAKEYGTPDAKVYTDYKELLADPTIDAVHVLTPNIAHCEITIAAASTFSARSRWLRPRRTRRRCSRRETEPARC